MKNSLIVLLVVVVAIVIAGLLFFSVSKQENDINQENYTQDETQKNQTRPQTYKIEIKNFAFIQQDLNINAGDTVIWTNLDSTAHTITSDSGDEIDSLYLNKGENYSHTFMQQGTYSYHCTPHPGMKGKIIVE